MLDGRGKFSTIEERANAAMSSIFYPVLYKSLIMLLFWSLDEVCGRLETEQAYLHYRQRHSLCVELVKG
jgi:hypothetical protein